MKKLSMFALLLLAFVATTAANAAVHKPLFRQPYRCDYSPGPWTTESDPGISSFGYENWVNPDLVYGVEGFESTTVGFDNRRVAFAKFVDYCGIHDPTCADPDSVVLRTKAEFTIANSIQCKDTWISDYGRRIVFGGCSNGKSRICTAY